MSLTAPRGTADLLPEAAARAQHLEDVARQRFARAGYGEIRPPLFEDTAVFQRAIGEATDIVGKQMYTFTDRKGRSLTLRPEGTAGIVRAYIQRKLYAEPGPVKLFYVGPMFRYERPQAGRSRQFEQIGVELFGGGAPGHDVDVIGLAFGILADLGFDQLEVRLNSLGCAADRGPYVAQLQAYLEGAADQLCADCRARTAQNPIRVLDCKVESCRPTIQAAPAPFDSNCTTCRDHYDRVLHLLGAAGLPHVTDHSLVRGLDYYTRTVFEIHHARLGARSALCGGGRYDDLVEQLGGPPTPAVGFSIGVEPTLLAAEGDGIPLPACPPLDAVICPLVPDAAATAQRLVDGLRAAGLSADVDWSDRSVKAQLKAANRRKVRYAVIIGTEELAADAVQVRDLAASEQVQVATGDVVTHVQERSPA